MQAIKQVRKRRLQNNLLEKSIENFDARFLDLIGQFSADVKVMTEVWIFSSFLVFICCLIVAFVVVYLFFCWFESASNSSIRRICFDAGHSNQNLIFDIFDGTFNRNLE